MFETYKIRRIILCLACAAAFFAQPACALTGAEVKPAILKALGTEPPQKFFTETEGDLSRGDVLRMALEAMGWGFVIQAVDQIGILPEWPEITGVSYISGTMRPLPPEEMRTDPDAAFTDEELPALEKWLRMCKKAVYWNAAFAWGDTELRMIRRGVGDPSGPANGDIENGKNEPVFAALLSVDIQRVPCQIATAQMIGSKKAALATIAAENYGVIGGINGGYFAGAKPIGVLRRQGYSDNPVFWPNRSAFAWNETGEFAFIDGKVSGNISAERRFDKYTEVMQAGPLLVKNGEISANTEDIQPSVLWKRHPRTFVGYDGARIVWGVVDGRDNMHSVGMTVDELRKFCAEDLGLKEALNLDGGGSSSIWWRGMTFSLPSNASDQERPIPYAVLIFEPGAGVRR